MRISYVSNNGWPSNDAGLSFCLNNAIGFASIGADFELILHGRTRASVAAVLEQSFSIREAVPVVPLHAPFAGGSRLPFYVRAFLYLLKRNRDVVITRNLNFLPWAVLLRARKGVRLWYEAHDLCAAPALRDDNIKRSRRRHARLEKTWVPRVDGIICVSAPLAACFRRYYPQLPVVAATTGCKTAVRSARTGYSRTLGYIGSFDLAKYPLATVVEGLTRVGDPTLRLLCVGAKGEQEQAAVASLATRFGVGGRLEVHPWVTGARLEALKARIDVGVAALSETFLNRVASPLKVLEYLSASLPFIATRCEGIEAMVEHGTHGLLVRNTPAEWASAMRELYADFSRYRRMAEDCFELASRSGWDRRAATIFEALRGGQRCSITPDGSANGATIV
jgi:glycosyltransferase involved in cell wall biosynthesis